MMEEVWRDIDGYNGKYKISNLGRIKSYAQSKIGKIKTGYLDTKGYLCIYLYKEPQHGHWFKIHRLVAQAFIPNPHDYDQINHIDENKSNNRVDNLEWCNSKYNANYGTKIQRATAKTQCKESTSRRIYSIDGNGNKQEYGSINDAERKTGIYHSNIIRVLKGDRHKAGGLQWHYVDSL